LLPLDIPPGTTLAALVTEVIPTVHALWVGDGAATEPFTVALRIEGRGSWTFRIRGREMIVDERVEARPTLWMYTTGATADRFLEDALGPKRLVPKTAAASAPGGADPTGAVAVRTVSDPRVVRRVAMANGRIGISVVDDDGSRLTVVFGFGDATRRPIAPEDPDTVVEIQIATLEGILGGARSPDEALTSGDVTVRGSRLLAMQLALALAPLYPKNP
jgi:hypothetical protein